MCDRKVEVNISIVKLGASTISWVDAMCRKRARACCLRELQKQHIRRDSFLYLDLYRLG